ncbi:tyrosine-type recombinase/integrase [Pectobacterium carotovorum]|uniref:phage integrase n=1 Tax=Pectobacterium TaxID=122277 RepID=UPI0001A43D94|nr:MULTISPECIES: tyrosine-type recombinase/integrase [Pectobacterium]MBN3198427.1 tyrosine-type recombinase/integrase [Pectobacterium brasiliense]MDK9421890.1 tyrosine-type recombinase/integrase [Pectobacterium carotovorum]QLL94831.1 tyrosine-type recombinase/integrase [Pectobacterium carotovorum]ULS49876.1 tyrosine-type recombinase/integrase [Pectobacterium carotovorum]GKV90043.1 integrase [Pectobacterium carotovorum subsp. carotovorum]
MAVRKHQDGGWICEIYPNGSKGKRIRKKFATKGEAIAFEQYAAQNPWQEEKGDRRTLKELVDAWYSAHGITLKDGLKRQSAMHHAYECMGEPLARDFEAQMFSRYREKRLKGGYARSNRVKEVTPRTLNLELAYFRAMFNELTRLGEWKGENPLKNMRPFRTEEAEMAYLTQDQIALFLSECQRHEHPHLQAVVKICLSTGARWSEAENLRRSQLSPYKITFTYTKGRRNRAVPISKALYESLPENKGRLFTDCYGAFRSALERTGIELPAGQLTHVLRHTFASHFMMKGGNILVLQRVLGHTDIKMTMRYAHFAPEHLEDALRLNPLATSGDEVAV